MARKMDGKQMGVYVARLGTNGERERERERGTVGDGAR
jgi:hypothetical protein